MLSFNIDLNDIFASVKQTPIQWEFGTSTVKPFTSENLEGYCVQHKEHLLFYIRQRDFRLPQIKGLMHYWQLDDEQFTTFQKNCNQWSWAFISILINKNKKSIHIQNSDYAQSCIYLTAHHNKLYGHWNPRALYKDVKEPKLNIVKTLDFLYGFNVQNSHHTCFSKINQLPQQATALFSIKTGLQISLPEKALYLEPTEIQNNVDIVDVFIEEMSQACRAMIDPNKNTPIGIMFSGGVDSCLVLSVINNITQRPITATSLMMSGQTLNQQKARIDEMVNKTGIQLFSLTDNNLTLLERSFKNFDTSGVWPEELPFISGFDSLCQLLRSQNIETVFTGEFADQLCFPNRHEAENSGNEIYNPWTPNKPVSEYPYITEFVKKTYDIAKANKLEAPYQHLPYCYNPDYYLSQNLWAQHPFYSIDMFKFLRSLPFSWRKNKKIIRQALVKLGFSQAVAYPALEESFDKKVKEVFLTDNCPPEARFLLENSYLDKLGLINKKEALEDFNCLQRGKNSKLDDYAYMSYSRIFTMELAIRSIEKFSKCAVTLE